MRRRDGLRGLVAGTALSLPPSVFAAEPVHVLGTGAVRRVAMELAATWQRRTGHMATFAFGNATTVTQRLRGGERADLVLTSESGLDALVAAGLADGATRHMIGASRLGLAVRQGGRHPNIATPEALRRTLLATPSLARTDPAAGSSGGPHLAQMFGQLGIAREVAAKTVFGEGGIGVARRVAEGSAALGLTQVVEILAVPGAELVGPLPDALQLRTAYGVALTTASREWADAAALLRFLTTPEAAARFRAGGFEAIGG